MSEACRQIGVTDNTYHPGNSERHPLNSADGSVVRRTKRYTLKRRVATASTQITIREIPRHGKLKTAILGLLAQFGLTPKSKRGLVASESLRCSWMRCDRLAKDQLAEITMFQMSEMQELPAFNGRRSFLTYGQPDQNRYRW